MVTGLVVSARARATSPEQLCLTTKAELRTIPRKFEQIHI
jgi:hypothetical protein